MINKKNWIIILLLTLLFISCQNKKKLEEEKKRKDHEKTVQSRIFTDKPVEREISIKKFEKLTFENKNYYHSQINIKKNSAYTVNYDGIEVTSLIVKVGTVTGTDLGTIEDLVANLIEVSDENINDEEARKLYAEVLAGMKEGALSNEMTYKNGIKYGITIDKNTGEIIFIAQQI